MRLIICSIIILCIISIPSIFADTQKLSGNSHGYEISLIFSDGIVSGSITLDEQIINLNNIKVIERNDRLYIIDKQNDLKIFSKQLSSEKYLVIVKINTDDMQTKLRFIANSDKINKNTTQRNLFDAMEQKMLKDQKEKLNSITHKELQLLEKQKEIDAALKIHEDRLANIAAEEVNKPHGDKTSQSILDEWLKSQQITGTALVVTETIEEVQEVESVVVNHDNIETFMSIPHYQEWKKVLRYSVLVTDDAGQKFDSSYGEYIGNELSNVSISGIIKNPDGITIYSFDGVTDNSGEYWGEFLIPDRITTRGEYVISIDAVKTFEDDTDTTSSNSGVFFVFPSDDVFNNPPISNAGPDQHLASGAVATLDGSGSSDIEPTGIFYTWSQTSGTNAPLSSDTAEKPTLTVPDESGTFIFNLSVDDGSKTSVLSDNISITSLHSDSGSDQSVGIESVTLDGSGSGDALGHGITYSWTIIDPIPGGSTLKSGADDITNPTSEFASFTTDATGDYILQLVVDDGIELIDTDTVTITVT